MREARDELQLRVHERTAELRQANETLQAQIAKREQAEEALRSHAKRLETLKAIDRDILGAPSPEALAEVTLGHVRRLVPCLRTSITVFDLEAGEGTVYAAKDEHSAQRELAVGSRVPLSAYGDPAALAQGIVTCVPDILALPQTPLFRALAARGVRSWINVPLISQGELFGTLNIAWQSPGGFSADAVDLAREVANGVALGIRQARLLEQVQRHAAELVQTNRLLTAEIAERTRAEDTLRRHARRLEGLQGLHRSILGAGSPHAVAQIGLLHIRQAVPCRRASVAVFDFTAAEATVYAVQAEGETRLTGGSRVPLDVFGDIDALRRGALNFVADADALPSTPVLESLKAEGLRAWIN
ncbi:MAG: GAF domain-containing protein, partial [Candidatus Rokuibacteriota bacterium]